MFRITAFLTGVAAFVTAHALEVFAWRTLFEPAGEHGAWFLNSGWAVAFTAACLFLASLAFTRIGRPARAPWVADAGSLAAGATVAMTAVLTTIGPGTIFPIALTIGAIVAATACAAGSALGTKL